MDTEKNRITRLYGRLLEISRSERDEIEKHNYEKIEHCCSLKEDILKEIDDLKNNGKWDASPEDCVEIETIIKNILVINNANAEAVRELKDRTLKEMAGLNKRKTAIRAYGDMSQFE